MKRYLLYSGIAIILVAAAVAGLLWIQHERRSNDAMRRALDYAARMNKLTVEFESMQDVNGDPVADLQGIQARIETIGEENNLIRKGFAKDILATPSLFPEAKQVVDDADETSRNRIYRLRADLNSKRNWLEKLRRLEILREAIK